VIGCTQVRGASLLDRNEIVDDLLTPCSPGDTGVHRCVVLARWIAV